MEECKIQLYAEFEMQDEAAQEAEAQNVVKTLEQMQEEFMFSEVDGEESKE